MGVNVLQMYWREFNAHFRLATYTDLQVAQYAEALIFVKNAYRALTETNLDLPSQAEPGLE